MCFSIHAWSISIYQTIWYPFGPSTRFRWVTSFVQWINKFLIFHFSQDLGFTLRSIRLDFNLLEYLDSTMFTNTQYLTELSLSNNQLKILPDNTFATLSNLTSLDLSFNPLITTNFKELLLNIPRLRNLNLSSTGLYTVPTLFLNGMFTDFYR